MTAKKNLKRRVRERQAKTGESYTAARAHIVSARRQDEVDVDHELEDARKVEDAAEEATAEPASAEPATAEDATTEHATTERATAEPAGESMNGPPFSVVELVHATDEAARLGFKCEVLISPTLVRRLAPTRMLEQLRRALLSTENDPQMELLRGLVFRGQRSPGERDRLGWWEDARRFFVRAAAGIGGVSPLGDLLAFTVDGEIVVAHAGYVPGRPLPWGSQVPPRLFLTEPDAHRIGSATLVTPR